MITTLAIFGYNVNWIALLATIPLLILKGAMFLLAITVIIGAYWFVFWHLPFEHSENKKEAIKNIIFIHLLTLMFVWTIWGSTYLYETKDGKMVSKNIEIFTKQR